MTATDTLRLDLEPSLPLDVTPGRSRSDRATVLAITVGVVAVVAARLWTSRGRRLYEIWPDEPAQLAMARFVGGGGARWNMYNHSTWRPGYATLVGAVYRFTDDPTTVFRSALVINAALGGVTFVLLYVLARRLTGLGGPLAALIAVLVSLAPSMVFSTIYVWSEGLTQPLYLGALLVLLAFHDRPSLVLGAAAGLLSAAAFATHSRMLPLALIVVAVAVAAVVRRRLSWGSAVGVGAVTGAGFLAVSAYSRLIVDRLWERPHSGTRTAPSRGRRTSSATP